MRCKDIGDTINGKPEIRPTHFKESGCVCGSHDYGVTLFSFLPASRFSHFLPQLFFYTYPGTNLFRFHMKYLSSPTGKHIKIIPSGFQFIFSFESLLSLLENIENKVAVPQDAFIPFSRTAILRRLFTSAQPPRLLIRPLPQDPGAFGSINT